MEAADVFARPSGSPHRECARGNGRRLILPDEMTAARCLRWHRVIRARYDIIVIRYQPVRAAGLKLINSNVSRLCCFLDGPCTRRRRRLRTNTTYVESEKSFRKRTFVVLFFTEVHRRDVRDENR